MEEFSSFSADFRLINLYHIIIFSPSANNLLDLIDKLTAIFYLVTILIDHVEYCKKIKNISIIYDR